MNDLFSIFDLLIVIFIGVYLISVIVGSYIIYSDSVCEFNYTITYKIFSTQINIENISITSVILIFTPIINILFVYELNKK